jgi:hypothetical protein
MRRRSSISGYTWTLWAKITERTHPRMPAQLASTLVLLADWSSLMVTNRSVPATTALPHITYRNVAGASDWLTAMFGLHRALPLRATRRAERHPRCTWVTPG